MATVAPAPEEEKAAAPEYRMLQRASPTIANHPCLC